MKGILLSLFVFILFILSSIIYLKAYRGKKYYRVFLAEAPFMFLLYLFLFRSLPDHLYFLAEPWVEPSALVDFWNGTFILGVLFFLFWDTMYAAFLTGFASEVLVRLFYERTHGLSLEALVGGFGGKEKIDHILSWRLPSLLKNRYIVADGEHYRLTSRGRAVARFALFLKQIFHLEEGG